MDQQTAKKITIYADEYCIDTFTGNVKLNGTTHYHVQFIEDDLLFSTPLGALKFIEAIAEERNLVRRLESIELSKAV